MYSLQDLEGFMLRFRMIVVCICRDVEVGDKPRSTCEEIVVRLCLTIRGGIEKFSIHNLNTSK